MLFVLARIFARRLRYSGENKIIPALIPRAIPSPVVAILATRVCSVVEWRLESRECECERWSGISECGA